MALTERPVLFLAGKQGVQPLQLKGHFHALFQTVNHAVHADGLGVIGFQRRAHSSEEVGVFRIDGGFRGQLQGADKGLFQLRQEVQGAAQEGHAALDGLAAGETGNGLIDHRLENGGGQIRLGRALVDERLDVGFGEHAAPGGDGVDFLIVLRFGV